MNQTNYTSCGFNVSGLQGSCKVFYQSNTAGLLYSWSILSMLHNSKVGKARQWSESTVAESGHSRSRSLSRSRARSDACTRLCSRSCSCSRILAYRRTHDHVHVRDRVSRSEYSQYWFPKSHRDSVLLTFIHGQSE